MATRSRSGATRLMLAGLALGGASPTALARPRLELGGFTGVLLLDRQNELGNAWAPEQVPGTAPVLGVRAGYLARAWTLGPGKLALSVGAELRLALSSTGDEPAYDRRVYLAPVVGAHLQLELGYAPDAAKAWEPCLVVGGGPEAVVSGSPYVQTDADAAVYWGVGLNYHLPAALAVRLDLRQGVTAGREAARSTFYEIHLGVTKRLWLGKVPPAALPQDVDDDGITDADDKCPREPETYNSFEDGDGCADNADLDNDGIKTDVDKCPTQIENFNGIADEDGCPETDVDNDRILSHVDACPEQAEDYDKFQDEDGCPDLDNDGDAVPDALDECPAEPETRNGYLDDDGCPDELPREVAKYAGDVAGIVFETGDARIKKSSFATLGEAVKVFRKYPELRIVIIGHTDDVGTRDANVDLSRRRAEAVKWWLVDRGIVPERIEAVGKGPDLPKVPNTTPQNRETNRRIEFQLVITPAARPTPGPR